MGILMHHPDLDGASTEAVSEAQAVHYETLGWQRTPPPGDDAPAEVFEDTVVGTTSSLGDELVIVEGHTDPDLLDIVPDGTVDEVLAWVNVRGVEGDHGWQLRARLALQAEEASDHPRKGIIEPLNAALTPEED